MATTLRARRMTNELVTDVAIAIPPGAVAVLSIFGVPIADAVQAVMLFWAVTLCIQQIWRFTAWIRARGWRQ